MAFHNEACRITDAELIKLSQNAGFSNHDESKTGCIMNLHKSRFEACVAIGTPMSGPEVGNNHRKAVLAQSLGNC